ncbi:nicotinate-nucleotide adenylyltransferase [Pelotomaculum propionicicum]|uniref:nicotinate-nucleotide adenylyltransferase n=1 Tax=Pelotomaculum propionicicum TaxID=258475 RepID=UPI003B7972AD
MNTVTARERRLGIMGGTFDPVHFGHLVAAEGARYSFSLEKVIFIPAGNPPHKPDHIITEPSIRYKMTCLAVASNPSFCASDLEVERPGPSFTIDTVRYMMRLHPNERIFFITGADALIEISTWKNFEVLLSICNFVAATRPGYRLLELKEKLDPLPDSLKQNISYMEVPALAISSTDIRQRVREGRPIKYLLPESVEDYIIQNNLYRQ